MDENRLYEIIESFHKHMKLDFYTAVLTLSLFLALCYAIILNSVAIQHNKQLIEEVLIEVEGLEVLKK